MHDEGEADQQWASDKRDRRGSERRRVHCLLSFGESQVTVVVSSAIPQPVPRQVESDSGEGQDLDACGGDRLLPRDRRLRNAEGAGA